MTDSGELERNIGFLEAMTLGGGTMIGAGIFVLPGIAAEGAGPASAISFVIAGVVALLAALSLAELATGMPVAGGSYHYVNRALGGLFGSVVGWGMWTGLMFASAFYMIGFGRYLVEPIQFLAGRVLVVTVGLVGLAGIVGLNYYGTEESGRLQNLLIGTETAVVLAYVALGLLVIDPANLATFAPTGPSGVIATTGVVFVSFLGFEIIATVAGEVRAPGRTIPATMLLSVVLVTALYAVVMIVSTGVVEAERLGDSLVPVADVARVAMGPVGVVAVVAAAAIAAISSSNSSILAAARVNYAMGRDDLMSPRLNVTHDRFGTPHRAIVVTGLLTSGLIATGLGVEAVVGLLAEVASFSFLVSYSLVHVALVVFRRADVDDYDPTFEIPDRLYPAVPVLGVATAGLVISQMSTSVVALGSGVLALGGLWYLGYARDRAIDRGLLGAAVGGDRETYTVVVPVANPETQRDLLRLGAAVARARAGDRVPTVLAVNVLQVADAAAGQNVAAQRLDHQHELLGATEGIAASMDVTVRTRAVTGQRVDETILDVLDEEAAEQVLLGWTGTHTRRRYAFGPNLDAVVEAAPCEVSLVVLQSAPLGAPAALVGEGPHSAVAARQARAFARIDGSVPTLLHVQRADSADDADPEARGRATIADVAERAGLNRDEYESRVVVADDVETAVVAATRGFRTVCVGLTERVEGTGLSSPTIAERLSAETTATVAVVRGADRSESTDGTPLGTG